MYIRRRAWDEDRSIYGQKNYALFYCQDAELNTRYMDYVMIRDNCIIDINLLVVKSTDFFRYNQYV